MSYAKSRQEGDLFNYYAMNWSRRLIVDVEVICFLHLVPSVCYKVYDLAGSCDLIELDAISQHFQQITEEEYEAAYKLARVGKFTTYLSV